MWPFDGHYCKSKVRLDGKTVVITGANCGIGKETARDLYRRGARVILACRSIEKATDAIEDIKITPTSKSERNQFNGPVGELIVYKLDLCSFASIQECAKSLNTNEKYIHVLINNAAILMCPFAKTEDGYETQFQTNYLGHFYLTLLLLPKLQNSPPSRIINVSSKAHSALGGDIHFDDLNMENSYSPLLAYSQSKLANILFTKELVRQMKKAEIEGITLYSVHPGIVLTEIGRHLDSAFFSGARKFIVSILTPFLKNPEMGAQTTIYCATSKEAGTQTGLYYSECTIRRPSRKARNSIMALKLWNESLKMIGLEPKNNLTDVLAMFSTDTRL